MFKTFLSAAAAVMMTVTVAKAEFTFVIPQEPGGGTSVWAQIVAEQLETFLGESIRFVYIPGARDVPGFNDWHNELQFDDRTIMVSHGGNGVAFLQENVDYDYREYESVGLQNLNIIAGRTAGVNFDEDMIRFAAGSGMVPEAFAMTMLECGPGLSTEEYISCFEENVLWVNGMSGGERRLAFQRGELNGTRENPAAFLRHVQPLIDEGTAEMWFHHGLLDAETGTHVDDPNFPGYQFEALFEERWGEAPSGEFYNAYVLVKSFRDGLQKALWMNPDSPYLEEVRAALRAMTEDEEVMATLAEQIGDYEWLIGEEGNQLRDTLMTFVTVEALETLVQFNEEALGLASVFKPELAE